jgi:hypothetical protein
LVVFLAIWLNYRRELNRRREDCRKFIMALLDARFDRIEPRVRLETVAERNIIVYQNETLPAAPDMLKLPKAS